MKRFRLSFLLIFVLLASGVFAANISIPSLELFTRGFLDGGSFTLQSRGEMDFLLEGGYKFGGRVSLGFFSSNIETDMMALSSSSTLNFKSASVVIRELFSLPVNFTYFIGEGSTFISGDLFPKFFAIIRFCLF